jgi:hypothetical protein
VAGAGFYALRSSGLLAADATELPPLREALRLALGAGPGGGGGGGGGKAARLQDERGGGGGADSGGGGGGGGAVGR